jgi:hypothetical protein
MKPPKKPKINLSKTLQQDFKEALKTVRKNGKL